MVLFIHRPALLGLTEGSEDIAELSIAKNRSGEMAIIKLSFSGDIVKFSESLGEHAKKVKRGELPPQDLMPWEQPGGAGQYDPFAPFDGRSDFQHNY